MGVDAAFQTGLVGRIGTDAFVVRDQGIVLDTVGVAQCGFCRFGAGGFSVDVAAQLIGRSRQCGFCCFGTGDFSGQVAGIFGDITAVLRNIAGILGFGGFGAKRLIVNGVAEQGLCTGQIGFSAFGTQYFCSEVVAQLGVTVAQSRDVARVFANITGILCLCRFGAGNFCAQVAAEGGDVAAVFGNAIAPRFQGNAAAGGTQRNHIAAEGDVLQFVGGAGIAVVQGLVGRTRMEAIGRAPQLLLAVSHKPFALVNRYQQ